MNRTVALRHTLYERTTPKKKKKPAALSSMSPVKSSMKFDSTTSHSIRPDKLNEVERLLSPYRQYLHLSLPNLPTRSIDPIPEKIKLLARRDVSLQGQQ